MLTPGSDMGSEGLTRAWGRGTKVSHWRLRFKGGVGVGEGELRGKASNRENIAGEEKGRGSAWFNLTTPLS